MLTLICCNSHQSKIIFIDDIILVNIEISDKRIALTKIITAFPGKSGISNPYFRERHKFALNFIMKLIIQSLN